MKTLTLLATAALALAASLPASAHTPYLVPSNFAPRAGQTIALDASFAETFLGFSRDTCKNAPRNSNNSFGTTT